MRETVRLQPIDSEAEGENAFPVHVSETQVDVVYVGIFTHVVTNSL